MKDMNVNAPRPSRNPGLHGVALALSALVLFPAGASAAVLGTPGADRLGAPSDRGVLIQGFGGEDQLTGAAGDDRLHGDTGPDRLYGMGGNDLLDGLSGDDLMDGGAGDDRLIAGFGHDTLQGGDGNDFLDGGAAPDALDGGAGHDVLHGGTATDQIGGGPGNDEIHTTSGADVVDAGDGDDVVYVNNGSAVHSVTCGPGADTLYINPADLSGGWSNARAIAEGRIQQCEIIIPQVPPHDPDQGITWINRSGDASKTGTERNDNLLGGPGNEAIQALGGDDIVWGNHLPDGSGTNSHDRLYGDAGKDTIYGGRGSNHIDGGSGDDYLQGGDADNEVWARDGDDQLRVTGTGTNRFYAGNGNDTVYAFAHGDGRDRVSVDCGPDDDTVYYGRTRPDVSNCETVMSLYSEEARRTRAGLPVAVPLTDQPYGAKLTVERAGVADGSIDVLARITGRANGERVLVKYLANGSVSNIEVTVKDRKIRFKRKLDSDQRRLSTGILEISYLGNDRVRPFTVRVRAANGKARLQREEARIDGDTLHAAGIVSSRARGVIRFQLGYLDTSGRARFHTYRAPILRGKWKLEEGLPADFANVGQLTMQFTGYFRQRIRGEQDSKQVTRP